MNYKTVLLNGSPKTNSLSMRLAHELIDLKHVKRFTAYDMSMHTCTDCKRCMRMPGCIFDKDGATRFIEALDEADTLIIVSPVHFGSLSSEVVRLLSRLQTLYNGKHTRGDVAPKLDKLIFITTAGADNDAMFEGAHLTYKILTHLFNPSEHTFTSLKNTDSLGENESLLPYIQTRY